MGMVEDSVFNEFSDIFDYTCNSASFYRMPFIHSSTDIFLNRSGIGPYQKTDETYGENYVTFHTVFYTCKHNSHLVSHLSTEVQWLVEGQDLQ